MIQLTLALNSPLIISGNRNDNLLESIDYIPGTVLRGALAASFLKSEKGGDENLFKNIFLSGKVHFGNSYYGTENVSNLPATARSCKSFSGFKDPNAEINNPKHGVLDILIRSYVFQKNLRNNIENSTESNIIDECLECGSSMIPFLGVYAKVGMDERYFRFENQKNIITRTSINENTQTAIPGALFSTEVIQPDNEYNYHGKIIVYDTSLEQQLIDLISNSTFTIGGERTYGYGQVEVIEARINTYPNSIEAKLVTFNDKLKEYLPDVGSQHFVVTLNSDTILVDRFLRFSSMLNEIILKDYFHTELNFKLVKSFCTTKIVQGWSNIHKLPKENDLAILKGGVFLFKTEIETDPQILIEYLQEIESQGIGERKTEGFGEVIICNPFHLEVDPI